LARFIIAPAYVNFHPIFKQPIDSLFAWAKPEGGQ
jgi:hypothetical protein